MSILIPIYARYIECWNHSGFSLLVTALGNLNLRTVTFFRQVTMMHASWLVVIAAIWSRQGRIVTRPSNELSKHSLQKYWLASRQRANQWSNSIFASRNSLDSAGASARSAIWQKLRPVIEEVLLSEVQTRVIAHAAVQMENYCLDQDASPIANSVFVTHLEARHRCLQFLVSGPGLPVDELVELNHIRHYLERWTDLLLSQMGSCEFATNYCFDQNRLYEFSEELKFDRSSNWNEAGWNLRLVSVRNWIAKHCRRDSPNANLNQKIAESTLGLLHPHGFDSLGCLRSALASRLYAVVDETSTELDKLLPSLSIFDRSEQEAIAPDHIRSLGFGSRS